MFSRCVQSTSSKLPYKQFLSEAWVQLPVGVSTWKCISDHFMKAQSVAQHHMDILSRTQSFSDTCDWHIYRTPPMSLLLQTHMQPLVGYCKPAKRTLLGALVPGLCVSKMPHEDGNAQRKNCREKNTEAFRLQQQHMQQSLAFLVGADDA